MLALIFWSGTFLLIPSYSLVLLGVSLSYCLSLLIHNFSFSTLFSFDIFSLFLIFLLFWSILFSLQTLSYSSIYPLLTLVLSVFIVSFVVISVSASSVVFFIFMEFTLLPVVWLVLYFGPQPERMSASVYLWLFTMSGSLPLLLYIITMSAPTLTFWGDYPSALISVSSPLLLTILVLFAFFINAPVYGVHFWLPQAHVQASTLGSVLLAAVVLNVSTLGIYRFTLNPILSLNFFSLSSSYVILGGCLASCLAITQTDLKSLIAYSSVCHIAVPIFILVNTHQFSPFVSLFVSVGHGFCSAGLFAIGSYLSYYFSSHVECYMCSGYFTFAIKVTFL